VLERTLQRPEVKALYTIPTFHNPLGTTTSLAHRRQLLAIAARCGKPVIEDAYEADLRFAGRPVPSLAALDASGLVVQLSSFSKSLFPGVRVGAIAARGRAVDALLALKQASDHSDAMPLQAALAEFVAAGDYDRHLARLRRVLIARRDALLAALAEHLPAGSRWTTPEGGYQIWVELPEGIDTRDLLADAVGAGVLFAPGSQFNHDGRASRGLRLSIAMADEAKLTRGVAALGRVLAARLGALARPAARVHI
jgi:DNA-binding transcriptional MocR family regulator